MNPRRTWSPRFTGEAILQSGRRSQDRACCALIHPPMCLLTCANCAETKSFRLKADRWLTAAPSLRCFPAVERDRYGRDLEFEYPRAYPSCDRRFPPYHIELHVAEKRRDYGLAAIPMDFGRGSRKHRRSGHTGGSG